MNHVLKVGKNEEKIFPVVWINGQEKEITLKAELEEGASLHIVGVFLGTGNNSVLFNTDVKHKGKNTWSRTDIRGVFKNHSSFSNDGLVTIIKGAKGADGYFSSKILLFDDAKGRSVPSLEIDENELKAGHASTVGKPDEAQLFYLRSRGLSEKEAENLLVSGFFDPLMKFLSKDSAKKTKQEIGESL
jgi:Fe-S cluster assembly protein SufD